MIAQALVTLALVLNGAQGATNLSELVPDDPFTKALRTESAAHETTTVPDRLPRPAPPLDVDWLTAEPPAELKVLLVRFWNVDCDTCVATLPQLEALCRRYEKRGLVVVGIHMSQQKKNEDRAVRAVLQEQKITFPIAQDRDGKTLKAWWLFRPRPTRSCTAVVDAQGRIVWLRSSTDRERPKWESDLKDLEREIRKLLAPAQRR